MASGRLHTVFYLPNIICYIRLVLLCCTTAFALHQPIAAIGFYFSSAILDAADGYLARRLGQESYLGAVLDYTIDRASICVMQIFLALIYPTLWVFFAFILALDIGSHVCHLYSSLFLKRKHHKEVSFSSGKWLNLYYTKRTVLFFTCFFHDVWFIWPYLYHFYPEQTWLWFAGAICLPGFVFKTLIHMLQIKSSLRAIVQLDESKRLS
jgi:CDP-diacylglycerol--inositol 3-phosphatidyltransferase